MSNENRERRTYRKSPGRLYNYEHDPLHNRTDAAQRSHHGNSRPGPSVERPDPRRTRQLLRQGILASKRSAEETTDYIDHNDHIDYRKRNYRERRPIVDADAYASSLEPRRLGQEANLPDYPPRLSSGVRRRSAANAPTEKDFYQEGYNNYDEDDNYNNYGNDENYDDGYDEEEENDYAVQDDWQEPAEEELADEDVEANDRYQARNNYYQDDNDSEYDSEDEEDEDYDSEPEAIALASPRRSQGLQRSRKTTNKLEEEEYPLEYPAEDDNYMYEYSEDNPSVLQSTKRKKKGESRR